MATSQDYSTITSSMLQPKPKLVVPPTPQDTTPYQSIIDGALMSLPSVNTQLDSANKTSENLLKGVVDSSKEILGKEGYSQQQQDIYGVNTAKTALDDYNAQFNDLAAQIKGLSRASQAVPLQVQENNLGTGATDRGVAPQEAGMLRKNAIKALTLASTADVLGSQITNAESRLARAKESAQQAVDLKYKPIEAQNAFLKEFLTLNDKYIVAPAEKKKQEATQIALAERSRLLQEKKENEKQNSDLIINASSQLAPASVLANAKAAIAKGAKPAEVATILGAYSGDYIGVQLKLKQMKLADLDYKIKNNEFIISTTPALAQNTDGTVIQGSGANAVDRNTNTIEQIIKRNGKSIPDGTQTQIATALGVINTLKEFASTNKGGVFPGLSPVQGFIDNKLPDGVIKDAASLLKGKETVSNEGLLGAINLKVQQWASGASLTLEQTKLVQGMVPKKGDSDTVVKQKIATLTDMMNTQVAANLTSAGIKYRPEKTDYYDNSTSSKIKNAVGVGYAPKDILDAFLADPVEGAKIKAARAAGVSDEDIIARMQALTSTP